MGDPAVCSDACWYGGEDGEGDQGGGDGCEQCEGGWWAGPVDVVAAGGRE